MTDSEIVSLQVRVARIEKRLDQIRDDTLLNLTHLKKASREMLDRLHELQAA